MSLEGLDVEGTDLSEEIAAEESLLGGQSQKTEYPKGEKKKEKQEKEEKTEDKIVLEIIEKGDYSKSKYKKLYEEIFANYSLTKFREHLNLKHPTLKRLNPEDGKKLKVISLMGESNAILRGMGYVLGLKRTKAKSTKKTKYEDAFNEREDLRELVIAKIMMPMLVGIKEGDKSILQQDLEHFEEKPQEKEKEETKPINNFRVGAVIDIEKLGISVDLLRKVLTGEMTSGKESEGGWVGPSETPIKQEGESASDYKERVSRWKASMSVWERHGQERRLPESDESGKEKETTPATISYGYALTDSQLDEVESRLSSEFSSAESELEVQMAEVASDELKERYEALKLRRKRREITLDEAIQETRFLIDGYVARKHAQRESSGAGLHSHAYIKLSQDLNVVRTWKRYLESKLDRATSIAEEISEQGSVDPATQNAQIGSHDARKLAKESRKAFGPGVTQTIKRASQLLLKSVKKPIPSKMRSPITEPSDVNYYAPSVRHKYKGGLRVIQ
jgi:hypothetical protein